MSDGRSVPDFYSPCVDDLQDVARLPSKPKQPGTIAGRLCNAKTEVGFLDRLQSLLAVRIAFDVITLIVREDEQLRNGLLRRGLDPESLQSQAGPVAIGKVGIDRRENSVHRVDLRQCSRRQEQSGRDDDRRGQSATSPLRLIEGTIHGFTSNPAQLS